MRQLRLPQYDYVSFSNGQRVPVLVGAEAVTEEEFERAVAFARSAVLDPRAADRIEKFLRDQKWLKNLPCE